MNGHIGLGMITPVKKPAHSEPTEHDRRNSTTINRFRYLIERVIANLKNWRAHPHRLPPPLQHFRNRNKSHRGTHLRLHPMNKPHRINHPPQHLASPIPNNISGFFQVFSVFTPEVRSLLLNPLETLTQVRIATPPT